MKIASSVLLGLSPPRSTTNLASHVLKYPLAPVQQNTSSSAGRGSCAQSLGRRRRLRNLFATLFATAALTTIVARTHLQQHVDKRQRCKCISVFLESFNGTLIVFYSCCLIQNTVLGLFSLALQQLFQKNRR